MRKSKLKDIAAGICSSFISRNNSDEGYWALGKMYSYVKESGLQCLELDLLSTNNPLNPTAYSSIVEHYALWLQNQLQKSQNGQNIGKAVIQLRFNIAIDQTRLPRRETWGDPFEISVKVSNKKGISAVIKNYGYCAPHDLGRESRSKC